MTDREICIKLLEKVPDYKIGYVRAYLEGLTADEEADDAFCQKMYQDYLDDPDPDKDKTVSLEELRENFSL